MSGAPALSVVVGLISGERADLEHCLRALHEQTLELELEVLVPYDPPCAEVAGRSNPAVRRS